MTKETGLSTSPEGHALDIEKLHKSIKSWILFFIIMLILSGLTAFPIEYEAALLNQFFGTDTLMANIWPGMSQWATEIHRGISSTYQEYPFMAYGTDWLAFAHIVIAIAFIGPLREPEKNIWVIEFGLIACVMVLPLALICGSLRGIPFFWIVLDCSFGIIGFIPLWIIRKKIHNLQALSK